MDNGPKWVNGVPEWVKPIIEKASQAHGIPTIILSALLKQESGFNPNARSSAGALGISQFMPTTAKGMGVNPLDPQSAIDGAARYLKNSLAKFGKLDLALASYNAGGGAVSRFGNKIPPYPETQRYVRSIMGMIGEPLKTSYQPVLDMQNEAKKPQPTQPMPAYTPNQFNPADRAHQDYMNKQVQNTPSNWPGYIKPSPPTDTINFDWIKNLFSDAGKNSQPIKRPISAIPSPPSFEEFTGKNLTMV